MNALVSVVIPTYNHAHFLGRALQSVLDQTYPHWEALVVDNHSQDGTESVVRGFDDARVRLFKIRNNGVIAASRNLGMREARGEWIAFLDSDDCWYPKKLETLIKEVEADPACDVLSNDELMVDIRSGAKKVLRHGPYQPDFYRILLTEGNRLSPSATMVRRSFLARHRIAFDEAVEYVTVEDYGFWLDLARAGARFRFVRGIQGEFVIHADNNSARFELHIRNCEALLAHHVFKVQKFQVVPERLWQLVLPRLSLVRAKSLIASGHFRTALVLVLRTLASSPRGTLAYLAGRLRKSLTGTNA